ncbi:MAG: TlpA family protein disulfide reductase, partial [Pirellulaceae bacterium]|nr:TlpA family protein disulfide reductase [Pirellulaceae bacterium]
TDDFAGKFLRVDFFATWCEPCLADVPRLKRHYEKHHSKGLDIISISLDEKREVLDKYLETAKLPWPVIHDAAPELKDKLQIKYGVLSLPTVLLLNKEGVVVSLEARGAELDRLMDRIFEMPTPAEPETPGSASPNTSPNGSPAEKPADKATDKPAVKPADNASPSSKAKE